MSRARLQRSVHVPCACPRCTPAQEKEERPRVKHAQEGTAGVAESRKKPQEPKGRKICQKDTIEKTRTGKAG